MEHSPWVQGNLPVEDPEDMDFLLEFAEDLRGFIQNLHLKEAEALVRYTVVNGYAEAVYWALGILEECWSRASGALPAFECVLGRHIPEFDSMISRLEVDLKAAENDVVPIRDENGEIQSFYNILTYQSWFSHIRLVSSEIFDAKDNDFIEYRLICTA